MTVVPLFTWASDLLDRRGSRVALRETALWIRVDPTGSRGAEHVSLGVSVRSNSTLHENSALHTIRSIGKDSFDFQAFAQTWTEIGVQS